MSKLAKLKYKYVYTQKCYNILYIYILIYTTYDKKYYIYYTNNMLFIYKIN